MVVINSTYLLLSFSVQEINRKERNLYLKKESVLLLYWVWLNYRIVVRMVCLLTLVFIIVDFIEFDCCRSTLKLAQHRGSVHKLTLVEDNLVLSAGEDAQVIKPSNLHNTYDKVSRSLSRASTAQKTPKDIPMWVFEFHSICLEITLFK